ncbi:fasciclin domain-containing protein [Viscerimonas tarda]
MNIINNAMKKMMTKKTVSRFRMAIAALVMGIIPLLSSCEKEMEGQEYRVYDDKMLDEIMQEQQMTQFLSIVDKANFRGTIHAYGVYTLFAPTNEAVDLYLQANGKSSVNDLTEEEAANIVRYHLVGNDSIAIADFVDGRLRSRNFMKKYLTTKALPDGSIWVDRSAIIVTKALCGATELKGVNGHLHIINAVLTPPQYSVTDMVRALPDADYSLMKGFFERSGLADSLKIESDSIWYTFFVQDNQAFIDAGITSEENLLVQLHENQKNSTKTDGELIRDYIGYHAIQNIMPKYAVDLLYASALQTLTPEKKPILFERDGDRIWLDRLIVGQINEPGVALDRQSDYTDRSCSNGVVHRIAGNIQVKERTAYRVYWDIAEQPEIMALSTFRKPGANKTYNPGELSEVTWGGTYIATIRYECGSMPMTEAAFNGKDQYVYRDYLRFNLHPNTMKWVEFKCPVLMPGEYKVWLCYRRELNLKIKTIFKQEGKLDQVMPYIFNMNEYMPGGTAEAQELLGWKQYSAKKYDSVVCSHLLGTIQVEFEGRHTLRLEPIASNAQGQLGNWDLIQFIPKDENQVYPRVDMRGEWIDEGAPTWAIWPYGNPPAEPEPIVE